MRPDYLDETESAPRPVAPFFDHILPERHPYRLVDVWRELIDWLRGLS